VVAHLLQLAGVEDSGLEQDGIPDAQLADVVEQEAELELRVVGQLRRDAARELEGGCVTRSAWPLVSSPLSSSAAASA
jgi:hypothetical protein